jgi:hypothetical protein
MVETEKYSMMGCAIKLSGKQKEQALLILKYHLSTLRIELKKYE